MNFPLYIAKRYLRSASKNNAINIINRIAAVGVIAGAMALFVVLSVFSGLIDFSLSFSNTIDPDMKASSTVGKSFFISAEQEKKLANVSGIEHYSKVLEERVLFVFDQKEMVTYLKGVDSQYTNVSTVKNTVIDGRWQNPKTIECTVGYGIFNRLSMGLVDVNHLLEVYVPKPGKGQIDHPEDAFTHASLVPSGVFAISEELDNKYVFVDLSLAQALLGYQSGQVSALEIQLTPGADEAAVSRQLNTIFGGKMTILNRAQLNASLYKMLNTENIVLYLIFTLVIIIALFNLIGALTMMIIDKQSNLKTLLNLGANLSDLRRIFFLQGSLLTVFGGILGILLGILLIVVQERFGLVMVTSTLAYPVRFSLMNVLVVMATISVLGSVAAFIASQRVSSAFLK